MKRPVVSLFIAAGTTLLSSFPTKSVTGFSSKALLTTRGTQFRFSDWNIMTAGAAATGGISVSVSDKFDGGNIEFVEQVEKEDDSVTVIKVRIKPDPYTKLEQINHLQYFSFQATISGLSEQAEQTQSKQVKYVIENAAKVSYPAAWTGTTVFYTSTMDDPDSWKRNLGTTYVDGQLCWTHQHETNGSIFFSYFPPFTHEQHLNLISKCEASNLANVKSLGQSLDGRDIECISVGQGDRVCWIIHRQHPGETMAEYYAEGLLTRLLGLGTNGEVDDQVQKLLEMYTFYIVPSMCPDGSVRGHLRTNAAGANLNREWATKGDYEAPTLARSPEVYAVLNKMDETGVDIFLDIHGDEELPYNFISGAEKTPKWGKRLESLHGAFVAAYNRSNSDMQQNIGYPPPESAIDAKKYLNVATNQIATRFDCLAMTLEMPFKDCESNPDPEQGWSPERSRKLGASVLDPLEYVHAHLRTDSLFWNALPLEDAYVEPTDNYQAEAFMPLKKRMYSDVRALQ
jgi:murein tripeptide amidase MpaA